MLSLSLPVSLLSTMLEPAEAATCHIHLNLDVRIKTAEFAGMRLLDDSPEWSPWGTGVLVNGQEIHPERSTHCILTSAETIHGWSALDPETAGGKAIFTVPGREPVTVTLSASWWKSGSANLYSFALCCVAPEDIPKLEGIRPLQLLPDVAVRLLTGALCITNCCRCRCLLVQRSIVAPTQTRARE